MARMVCMVSKRSALFGMGPSFLRTIRGARIILRAGVLRLAVESALPRVKARAHLEADRLDPVAECAAVAAEDDRFAVSAAQRTGGRLRFTGSPPPMPDDVNLPPFATTAN